MLIKEGVGLYHSKVVRKINSRLLYIHVCNFTLQVRDEYRTDFDEGRGGYGQIIATKIKTKDSV